MVVTFKIFSHLQVHIDAEAVKHQEELPARQLDGAERVHGVVGEEAEHLVVGVDQGQRVLVTQQAVDREPRLVIELGY